MIYDFIRWERRRNAAGVGMSSLSDAADLAAAVNPREEEVSDGGFHVSQHKRNTVGRSVIGTMWAQLASLRCYEAWKDLIWQRQAFEWNRDRLELARLEHLQVRIRD